MRLLAAGFLASLGSAAMLAAASALANDVGLIHHVAGEVSYTSRSGTDKVTPFMKLREGDRVRIAPGAQMRVMYFQGGRQESYTGPASFTAGPQQSWLHHGEEPEVMTLPSGVPQKISQTPELIHIAKLGRSGGTAVRSPGRDLRLTPQQQAELRHARETYEQLRQSAAADDITPEWYLYSVLQDHVLYNDMKPVVAEMQRRQPTNPDVAVMVEYVNVKTRSR